ncbi:hypothetical protein CVT24_002530 [Panaeolus cyanescens]|uniref:Uncharacterized protein n=1 Tax=Panaeolus cyanescens TaxID=181874 RepID=A0A409YY48_9AGAR|nr:hypothetical protein CVT24_002530 [Panaeolus cyanescens]
MTPDTTVAVIDNTASAQAGAQRQLAVNIEDTSKTCAPSEWSLTDSNSPPTTTTLTIMIPKPTSISHSIITNAQFVQNNHGVHVASTDPGNRDSVAKRNLQLKSEKDMLCDDDVDVDGTNTNTNTNTTSTNTIKTDAGSDPHLITTNPSAPALISAHNTHLIIQNSSFTQHNTSTTHIHDPGGLTKNLDRKPDKIGGFGHDLVDQKPDKINIWARVS